MDNIYGNYDSSGNLVGVYRNSGDVAPFDATDTELENCCCGGSECVDDCGADGTCDDSLSSVVADVTNVDISQLNLDDLSYCDCSPSDDTLDLTYDSGACTDIVVWNDDSGNACVKGERCKTVELRWEGAWYLICDFCAGAKWHGCKDGGDSPLGRYYGRCGYDSYGYIDVS